MCRLERGERHIRAKGRARSNGKGKPAVRDAGNAEFVSQFAEHVSDRAQADLTSWHCFGTDLAHDACWPAARLGLPPRCSFLGSVISRSSGATSELRHLVWRQRAASAVGPVSVKTTSISVK